LGGPGNPTEQAWLLHHRGARHPGSRGPLWAGALVGLVVALGGYGAAVWWFHGRMSVYKLEAILAFGIGTVPGFLLQYLVQRLLRKR
jgi:hypothetical protein